MVNQGYSPELGWKILHDADYGRGILRRIQIRYENVRRVLLQGWPQQIQAAKDFQYIGWELFPQ
jgi:hypothetical protein